ncbi:MAG: toll/interleukin-1 receptor domain-containing protein [Polyangiaceae bacterium]|nr:toll/interleukin-1 receptor domain-containing protein [Polyangiaceae bacterium]
MSHSHSDGRLPQKVMTRLEDEGLDVLSDLDIKPGENFLRLIKALICSASVFVAVIPKDTSKAGWVFQEIGFAIYHGIPIVPITRSEPPGQLLQNTAGIVIGEETEDGELERSLQRLNYAALAGLVERARTDCATSQGTLPSFRCARHHVERTDYLVRHATNVLLLNRSAAIRQEGGLSTFNIPNKDVHDPIWEQRAGQHPTDTPRRERLRAELLVFEEHVRASGSLYLMINPTSYCQLGWDAQACRLKILLEALCRLKDSVHEIRVALTQAIPHRYNLTILGDWFYGEAVALDTREGYQQTMFTHHCPEVLTKIAAFDRTMCERLRESGIDPRDSLDRACTELSGLVDHIRRKRTVLEHFPLPEGAPP